jgi:hypothetical protein
MPDGVRPTPTTKRNPTPKPSTNGQAEPDSVTRDPRQEILAALRVLYREEDVVELRAPGFPRGNATTAGYFDNADALAESALDLSGQASGVYVTLNRINPALLARVSNRVEQWVKQTTSDADVIRRCWLPLDFDPKRPAGVPSTDEEHKAALKRAKQCRRWLREQGWPEPITADSGNGAHLLYAIDLPNDDPSRVLVERCLQAVAFQFSDEALDVDVKVANAARIWKLYGTVSKKGDGTSDRPHRQSRILSVPEHIVTATVEQLEALAALAQAPLAQSAGRMSQRGGAQGFDLAGWIAEHELPVVREGTWSGGHKWVLGVCPWNDAHTNGAAFIVQHGNGAIAAGCHHNGCAGKGWHDLRDIVEPGWRERTKLGEAAAGSGGARTPRPVLPYKPFPLDALPEPIRQYVGDAAAAIGCDPAFIAVPMLAAIAAAIGNTRRVKLKRNWTEPAVIWAAVVAESGTHKSPCLELALAPVRQRQTDAFREWRDAINDYKKQDSEKRGKPPVCKRFLVSDTTVEALSVIHQDTPRGLMLVRDELGGWLGGMDAYRPKGKGGDVPHFLEMHRAGPLLIDRKSDRENPIHIPNAAVSIAGTIQPETLRRALGREHFEDGLAARFLLTMPSRQRRQWSEREIGADVQKAVARVFSRLYGLGFDPAHNDYRPTVLPLSKKAKDAWVAFYDAHASEQADLEGDLAAAWSKLEAYCARLALVIELVKWAALPPPKGNTLADQLAGSFGPDAVQSASIAAAVKLVGWFGHEARRVYAALGDSDEERERRRLVGWIQARGGAVTARELQQYGHTRYRGSVEDADAALDQLAASGAGTWVSVNPGDKGGRPTRRFCLSGATKPA